MLNQIVAASVLLTPARIITPADVVMFVLHDCPSEMDIRGHLNSATGCGEHEGLLDAKDPVCLKMQIFSHKVSRIPTFTLIAAAQLFERVAWEFADYRSGQHVISERFKRDAGWMMPGQQVLDKFDFVRSELYDFDSKFWMVARVACVLPDSRFPADGRKGGANPKPFWKRGWHSSSPFFFTSKGTLIITGDYPLRNGGRPPSYAEIEYFSKHYPRRVFRS